MPATHSIELHFSLPASFSPDFVVQHLQTYEPVIKAQALVLRYNRQTDDPKATVEDDPFFTKNDTKLEAYNIAERVVIIPVIYSKEVTFTSTFQSFPTGVRVRASAPAGVMVWSTFEVRQGTEGWELVETAKVEFSAILRPFVVKNFEAAHKQLCQKVIDGLKEVEQGTRREAN